MLRNNIMLISTKERKTWFGLQFVMVIVLQSLSQILYVGLYALFSGDGFGINFNSKTFLAGELFGSILTILIFLSYAIFIEKRNIITLGFTHKGVVLEGIKGWLLGAGCIVLIASVIDKLLQSRFVFVNNINLLLVGLYFWGFVVQGLSEEVIFRGYLMNGLATKLKPMAAIIISSLFFALVHTLNGNFSIWSFLSLLLLGVFLGLLFYKRQSIWLVAGVHAGWNFFLGVVFGSSVSNIGLGVSLFRTNFYADSPLLTGGNFGLEGSFITTIVLTVACLAYYIHVITCETHSNR